MFPVLIFGERKAQSYWSPSTVLRRDRRAQPCISLHLVLRRGGGQAQPSRPMMTYFEDAKEAVIVGLYGDFVEEKRRQTQHPSSASRFFLREGAAGTAIAVPTRLLRRQTGTAIHSASASFGEEEEDV
jgi:hypothetical protein